jgi:hypothetical protein
MRLFTGSAFSIRFGGASVASAFFFPPGIAAGDSSGSGVGLFLTPGFFAGSGVSFDPVFFGPLGFGVAALSFLFDFSVGVFAFGFGNGDSFCSAVGVLTAPGFLVGSGDSSASVESLRFGFGVGSSSSSPAFFASDFVLLFREGDSSGCGVGLFFGRGVGVGFDFGTFLDVALRFAGFGFAVGSGVYVGAGEATARISSRAFVRASRLFFSSSVNWALTKVATIAPRARTVPRKTRNRITAGERNRAEVAINPEAFEVKRAAESPPHRPRAPAPGEESRLVFHPGAKANRSDTSRSSAR